MGLFGKKKSAVKAELNWVELEQSGQVDEIISESANQPIIIFKHSTRCSISDLAKNRLEHNWLIDTGDAKTYFLDLLAHRDISNEIEQRFNVEHHSPQILVIKGGRCTYNVSHNRINPVDLKNEL